MKLRQPPPLWVVLVLLGAVAAGVPLVGWGDESYRRLFPAGGSPRDPDLVRPDWLWDLKFPLERVVHAAPLVLVVATLAMTLILAGAGRLRPRRGRPGPGALQVLVATLVGGLATLHFLLAAPPHAVSQGVALGLAGQWNYLIPGLVIGAWVAARRRGRRWRRDPTDRVARLVAWLWLSEPILLAIHACLFG